MATEPVGLAQDLTEQRVMRAQVGDQDLAIWRSASSTLQAWTNRCPHRGMRLSHGFVRGESLACVYHGWHYNDQGACHFIPAHPELEPPGTIKLTMFSVVEQSGVLWVNTEEDAQAVALPDTCQGLRSITLNCSLNEAAQLFAKIALKNDTNETMMCTKHSANPIILSYGDSAKTESVFVLLQQSSDTTTTAHIVVKPGWTEQGKLQISRWSESVRRLAERQASLPKVAI